MYVTSTFSSQRCDFENAFCPRDHKQAQLNPCTHGLTAFLTNKCTSGGLDLWLNTDSTLGRHSLWQPIGLPILGTLSLGAKDQPVRSSQVDRSTQLAVVKKTGGEPTQRRRGDGYSAGKYGVAPSERKCPSLGPHQFLT